MNFLKAFSIDFLLYGTSKATVAVTWIAIISTLTTRLSPENYAIFWQMFTLITGAATIATTGLVTAFRRYYHQFDSADQHAVYRRVAVDATRFSLLLSTGLFVPAFIASAWIGEWGMSPQRLLVGPVAFILASGFLAYCGHLMAVRKTVAYLSANAAQGLAFLLLCVLAPLSKSAGVEIMVIFLGASYLVTLPGYIAGLRSSLAPAEGSDVRKWRRDFLAFGVPLALMNVALLLGNLGTQLLLAKLANAQEAGIYAAFSAPIERLVGFSASIAAMAFLPLIASQWDAKRYREVLRFLFFIVAAVLLIAIAISAVLIVFAGPITTRIIDPRYLSGVDLIPLLSAATTASTTAAILADILILQKKTPQLAALFLSATLIGLLVSGVLIPVNGATGAVIGRLVFGLLACVFIGVAIRRNLSKSEPG